MNIRVATKSDLRSMDKWSNTKTEPAYLNLVVPGVVGASIVFTVSKSYAILDNLVTNPHVSKPVRQAAIDSLVAQIIEIAKKAEIDQLVGFSFNESTIERAKRFGFEVTNHKLLYKKLGV